MQNSAFKGFNYILTGIDLFSKKGYAYAMKNKADKEMVRVGKLLIKDANGVKTIRSDNGSEFISTPFKKLLQSQSINQVLSLAGKPQSNGNIERFNGVLKGLIRRALQYDQNNDWPGILKQLISNYNASKSSVTKATPDEIDGSKDKEKIEQVSQNIQHSVGNKRQTDVAKFHAGDRVRIKLDPNERDRNGQTFSDEIYTVSKVNTPKAAFSSVWYTIELGPLHGPNY